MRQILSSKTPLFTQVPKVSSQRFKTQNTIHPYIAADITYKINLSPLMRKSIVINMIFVEPMLAELFELGGIDPLLILEMPISR
jgi:hypothetical protein